MPILFQLEKLLKLSNKLKMAYIHDLADMDCHGWLSCMTFMDDLHGWLSWMTLMDDFHGWLSWMTFMDDFHEWLSWMTFMDDLTLLFVSYFYILLTDRLTDWQTDGQTDGHWYPLSHYRNWKSPKKTLKFSNIADFFLFSDGKLAPGSLMSKIYTHAKHSKLQPQASKTNMKILLLISFLFMMLR